MKKVLLNSILFIAFAMFTNSAICQDKVAEPYIVSIAPDSLYTKYEYSQTVFFAVSVSSTFGKDPTAKAMTDLTKQIVEACKINKFEFFFLDQIIFMKPFEEGKLLAYGTMIRKKQILQNEQDRIAYGLFQVSYVTYYLVHDKNLNVSIFD